MRRANIFEEPPTALHVGPYTPVSVRTRDAETERAIVRTVERLGAVRTLHGQIARIPQ